MEEAKHKQFNEAKWDRWAKTLDNKGWRNEYLRNAQDSLISILDIKENIHFLDIGCGTGWAIGQAAKVIDGKGLFYGVDLSQKMVEKAQENFKEFDSIRFIQASSEAIPLENDSFDIIISTNSFHHYLHPEKAMSEIARLLKVGGKIYILDPTTDTWIAKLANKIHSMMEKAHVKMYSTKEFKQFILNAGLEYVGCETLRKIHKVQIGKKSS